MSIKSLLLNLVVFFIFVLVTLIFFKPVISKMSSAIIDDYDGLMITWSLNRIIQRFPASPKKLMQGNIFYPYPYSHAYSDAFITDALIALPFVKATKEPLVAFNINLIISQALLLFFTYLFLSEFCQNFILSIMLALVFSFSSIRLHYLQHLQMFSLYWVPLSGISLMRFAKSGKIFFLYLFFFAFLAQILNSFLSGYFIIFLFLTLYLTEVALRKAINKHIKHFIVGTLLISFILYPLVKVYFYVSGFFGYVRPIRDVIHFSLSPEEIFSKFFSPNLIFLFIFSLGYFLSKKKKEKEILVFLFMTIAAFVLALGPVLHFLGQTLRFGSLPIPLPYTVFYYFIPGFKGFRTPSRWIFMFGFGAITFSALMLEKFLKKKAKLTKFLIYLLIVISVVIFTKVPKNYISVPAKNQYPQIYSWLKNQPGEVIVEIPIYFWGDFVFGGREVYRMLYGLEHGKKMVNGYSGFSPPEWEEFVLFLRKYFPEEESLLKLKNIGVDYLVIHRDELKDLWPKDFEERVSQLEKSKSLKQIYNNKTDFVYEFR